MYEDGGSNADDRGSASHLVDTVSKDVIPEVEEINAMHSGVDVRGVITVAFWIGGAVMCAVIAYWELMAMIGGGNENGSS